MKMLKHLIFLTIPGIYLYRKGKVYYSFFIIIIFSACIFFIELKYDYYIFGSYFISGSLISSYETTFTLNISENDQSLRFHRPILPKKVEKYPYQKEAKIITYLILIFIYIINFLIFIRERNS